MSDNPDTLGNEGGSPHAEAVPRQESAWTGTPLELKTSMAALQAWQRRFTDVLDQLPVYLILLSPDYHVLFENRFFSERFGLSKGRRCFEYLFHRNAPCEVCETYKVLNTLQPLEWDWTGPDGRNYHIHDYPFTDTDGSTIIMEVGLDVTNRVQAEKALRELNETLEARVAQRTEEVRESERRLQQTQELLDAVTAGTEVIMAALDLNFRYIYFNDPHREELRRLTGREPRLGLGLAELFADMPEQRELALEQWGRTLRGEGRRYQLEFGDPGRYRRVYAVLQTPIRSGDGAIVGAGEIAFDITDRIRAEEALQASETRFRYLFASMSVGFALHEFIPAEAGRPADYRFLEINPAFERLTGLKRKQVLGRTVREILPDIEPEWIDCYDRVATGREPVKFESYAAPLGKWFEVYAFSPAPGQFATVFMDITDRRRAMEELKLFSGEMGMLARRNAIMSRTAAWLLSSAYPPSIVEDLCRRVMRFLDCDVFFNYLAVRGTDRLQLNAYAGIADETAESLEWLDVGGTVCGCVAHDRTRIVAETIQTTPDTRTELVRSLGIRAYCCHPLLARGQFYGTLSFGTRSRDRFRPDEIELMNEVSDLTAIAMDRMAAEQALREASEDLNQAQAVAAVGSWRLNVRTNLLEWSDENWRIFGVPRETPLTYETFLSTVHPEDREYVDKSWTAALAGAPYDIEHRLLVDGRVKWVRERAQLEFDEQGGLQGGFGTTQDITERKAATAEMELLASFPQLNPNPVIELDQASGRLTYINPAGRRLFPDLPDLGGRHPFVADFQSVLDQLRSGSRSSFQREVAVETSIYSQVFVAIEGRRTLRVYAQDVTEHRRLEEQLRELERQRVIEQSQKVWQNTFDGITDLISVHNREGQIVMANRSYLDRFGLTPDSLAGQSCHGLFQCAKQCRPACPLDRTQITGTHQSGELSAGDMGRFYNISTYPYQSPAGQIEGVIQIASDITEKKQAQLRLIMSDRLSALGEMASGIAHEINNPLATISGCAEGLVRRIREGRPDPALFEEYAGIMLEEIERCKSITRNMLSLVRRGDLRGQILDAGEALDRTIELIGLQGRLREIEISRDYSAGPFWVQVSEPELKQVYIILLTNALDAQGDHGRIALSAGKEADQVWIRFRDWGTGIPPEAIKCIFDPFFTTKPSGTGLGLSIASKLVESMHGSLILEHSGSDGTTFLLQLPQATPSAP